MPSARNTLVQLWALLFSARVYAVCHDSTVVIEVDGM